MDKALFLDRDGTINEDVGYLHEISELKFVSGMPELIKRYFDLNYRIIVITNQSGIARGYYTESDMKLVNKEIENRLFLEYGIQIDAFYYCPHLPELTGECECRKPKPGLFLKAIEDWNIDPELSISIGDSERDEEASNRAGIKKFLYVEDVLAEALADFVEDKKK